MKFQGFFFEFHDVTVVLFDNQVKSRGCMWNSAPLVEMKLSFQEIDGARKIFTDFSCFSSGVLITFFENVEFV